MTECSEARHIHAYYDGELSPAEQVGFQAHLEQCLRCRQTLAELERLSSLIARAAMAESPAGLAERLQASHRVCEDRIILRLAGWFTATAAGIIIATLLSWPADRAEVAVQPTIWESVAVTPAMVMSDNPNSELLVVAQWMADDLGSTENGELR